MQRKSMLIAVTLLLVFMLAACGAPAAQESPSEVAPAAEAEAETEANVEAEAQATEEPAEEAEAEEAVAEEAETEATEEPAEESAETEGDEDTTYVVDTEASSVEWYGFRPAGGSESGTVQISEGQLNFEGTTLIDGQFVIDMTTIETTSQSGGMAERLVGHLSSDEFFGVETYPTATLVLKSAEPTDVENQYRVTGDLTIKETTDEIEFITDVNVEDDSLSATSEIIVDRATYDVRYGSGSFFDNLGDDLISDEMTLTVNLVAVR